MPCPPEDLDKRILLESVHWKEQGPEFLPKEYFDTLQEAVIRCLKIGDGTSCVVYYRHAADNEGVVGIDAALFSKTVDGLARYSELGTAYLAQEINGAPGVFLL
jgi:hypothetical protein